jgi:zinc/manganese transport system substrate-binding protein
MPDRHIRRLDRRHQQRLSMALGFAAVALVTALVTLLAGCGSSSSPAASSSGDQQGGKTLAVVAGENFWGSVASQIGGSHVKVTSIITDPNADPHSYETDPRDAAALSSSTFVIKNGLGYDDFIDKLLATNPNPERVVLSIAETVGVGGDNPNPHLWYDPDYVAGAAKAIEGQLAKGDPADAAYFAANRQAFLGTYQPYVDTLAAIKAKYDGAPIAYTERVPGYLVAAAGLRLGMPASFAQSIEDGNEPSPADTAAMDAAMRDKTVKVLFYNAQVTSPVTQKVQDLAKANGIPVVGVAETIPAGERDFQSWQIDQAKALLAALGG